MPPNPELPWFFPNQSCGTEKMRQPYLPPTSLPGETGSRFLGPLSYRALTATTASAPTSGAFLPFSQACISELFR